MCKVECGNAWRTVRLAACGNTSPSIATQSVFGDTVGRVMLTDIFRDASQKVLC